MVDDNLDRDDDDNGDDNGGEKSPPRESGGRGGQSRSQSYRRDRPSRGRPGGGGRFHRRPRVCHFCTNKFTIIDYKDVDTLRRFVTDRGRIRPRRQSGTCSSHQRELATSIKRARHLALLPFTAELAQE